MVAAAEFPGPRGGPSSLVQRELLLDSALECEKWISSMFEDCAGGMKHGADRELIAELAKRALSGAAELQRKRNRLLQEQTAV
jgi:hypothetical protein